MKRTMGYILFVFVVSTGLFFGSLSAGNLDEMFNQVEKLNIGRNGYTIGKALDKDQLKLAGSHSVKAVSADTFKFQDQNVFIVAHKKTNRVLVIYELFESMPQKKIQYLAGDLTMAFNDPTVMAHDKIVYWAYTKNGKVSTKQFDTAKEKKTPLDIFVTVKLVSEVKIMEKQVSSIEGRAYYIISSDKVLKQFDTGSVKKRL